MAGELRRWTPIFDSTESIFVIVDHQPNNEYICWVLMGGQLCCYPTTAILRGSVILR